MQLVLDTKNIAVTKKNGIFHIETEKNNKSISPAKLSSIAITANITISTGAIMLAIQHEIPILLFDRIGKAKARLWSPYFESIATLRRNQVRFADTPEATAWIIDLFQLKSEAQVQTLSLLRKKRSFTGLGPTIDKIRLDSKNFERVRGTLIEECRNQIMGTEGSLAKIYWQSLGSALPRLYQFKKRSRKPAQDNFNAALNYLYGMLYSVVEGSIFAAGLDPQLGLLHADEYRKPTLSFDLIEPFRPWVDALLVQQCLEKNVANNFFSKNQFGIFLNKHGKAFFIPLFNDFLRSDRNFLHQNTTVKNHIYFLSARLAQRIRSSMQ
ncbi:MAG: CRISPR-associated endonuclease Cas1 [Chitinophagales bacterium]|nr:CRISPR-associated endonuclease Cas1 [Chitinophagales bacterium]